MASKTLFHLAVVALAINSAFSVQLPQRADPLTISEAARLYSSEKSLADGSCRDYTLDKCKVNGILENIKDVGEAGCQMYCDVIFSGRCTFFIYDRKQDICLIMNQTIESYVETCKKVGGPNAPSINDCQGDTDPCNVSYL